MSNIIHRLVKPKDFDRVAHIYNQYLGTATLYTTPTDATYFQQLIASFDQREALWVVEEDGKVVGWGKLSKYSYKYGYRFACETSIFLDKNNLGKKLGSPFQQYLIEQAKVLEYKHICAKIMAVNTRSIEFHKKFGFEVVGIQKQIGYAHNQWHDVAILQLIL